MRCSHASVWESDSNGKLKMERPLSQPYGCQLPFQGEPLENGKLWECRMQSAQLNAERRVQSAELWDLPSAFYPI